MKPKFYIRSDEDFYEFDLSFCGRLIKNFKKNYFKKNSKHPARIYAKAFFPPDCPEHLWMYYLIFEINNNPYQITSITRECFDTLTRGIEPSVYTYVEFYTIDKHEFLNLNNTNINLE